MQPLSCVLSVSREMNARKRKQSNILTACLLQNALKQVLHVCLQLSPRTWLIIRHIYIANSRMLILSTGNFQPAKTLFQKTRIDANKRHMALSTRLIPPPPSRNSRTLPPNPRTTLPSPSPMNSNSQASSSRVTVNTVTHRRSTISSSTSAATTVQSIHLKVSSHNDRPPAITMSHNTATCQPSQPNGFTQLQTDTASTLTPLSSRSTSDAPPAKRSPAAKKNMDPMSLMFLPKRQPKAPPVQRPG